MAELTGTGVLRYTRSMGLHSVESQNLNLLVGRDGHGN